MFFLFYSFGKRNGGSVRRPSECFVIESSEMIVVSEIFHILLTKYEWNYVKSPDSLVIKWYVH